MDELIIKLTAFFSTFEPWDIFRISKEKAYHFTKRSEVGWVCDPGLNNSENLDIFFHDEKS